MPPIQPLMRFLRPVVAAKPAACRSLMRFSTATRLSADKPANSLNKASLGPSAASTAPATSTKPSPKASASISSAQAASRAADLAAVEAATEADSAQPSAEKPVLPSDHTNPPKSTKQSDSVSVPSGITAPTSKAKTEKLKAKSIKNLKENASRFAPKSTTIELPPPKYVVSRSANNNYPVYTDTKRGGNMKLTTVRKITGDLSALRDELRLYLNKKDGEVSINVLTQHVIVKGHHANEIIKFLQARGM